MMIMNRLFILFFLVLSLRLDAQQMLAQWNFNTVLPPDNNLLTGSNLPSMGSGTAFLCGGATPYSISPYDKGSDNDHYSTSRDNTGWNIRNFPSQRTGSRTAGIVFACNTAGYEQIVFKFDEKHSSSSPNTTVIQYNPDTLDPGGWVTVQVNKISDSTLSNEWLTRTVDLTSVPAVNNQPRFAIRVVASFDPAGDTIYVSTGSQNSATYNASAGTIRFDMAYITAMPAAGFEVTLPAVQASLPQIISTTDSSISFSFTRGSGDSVIILCKQDYAVNSFPDFGNFYAAASVFGTGTQIGVGNFVVYKSAEKGRNVVTVYGLTAGKEYNFAILEFSTEKLYKILPIYFHYTAGGTLFNPGDLMLVGFDTRVPGIAAGNDKHYLTNLVDIRPGTQFNLTSSRYEAGAPPNVKTKRWYNSGDIIYKDMDVLEFFWTGDTIIPAGSIIGIQNKFTSSGVYDSVTVNGIFQPLFVADLKKGGFNVATATTKGEQFYITQGSYFPVGDIYTDRYNLLFGRVLFGMTLRTDWVPLSASPGIASSGVAYRSSRIPDDIACLYISNLSDTVGAAYYTGSKSGTKRSLKSFVNANINWKWKRGDTTLNLTESFISPYSAEMGQPFIIQTSLNTDGTWLGNTNTDWFNCSNWEGLFIPNLTTDVIINGSRPIYPVLNATGDCRSIRVNSAGNITVNNGAALNVIYQR